MLGFSILMKCVQPLSLSLSSHHSIHTLPDRKVFLATWKEIPQSNEVQSTIENVQLSPGTGTVVAIQS